MRTSQVATILAAVIDPELGIDIVSLGLVYGIQVDPETVHVEMTMTSPDCPMGEVITEMAVERLRGGAGDRRVSLNVVTEPEWNIGMADAVALRRLGLVPR